MQAKSPRLLGVVTSPTRTLGEFCYGAMNVAEVASTLGVVTNAARTLGGFCCEIVHLT